MAENEMVDCIVRFHDPARVMEFDRCLFSLVGQSFRPLNIVMVVQRFSEEALAAVQRQLDSYLRAFSGITYSLHNYESAEPADARTALLNLGLQHLRGRYVGFLDYDDVLFPEAYDLLVGKLHESGAVVAFASVVLMQVRVYEKFLYNEHYMEKFAFNGKSLGDLFTRNFCPIHSYLIDRSRLPSQFLHFDAELTVEEDYDLLLRLCAGFPSDFSLHGTNIGIYCFKTDGSNTVALAERNEQLQTYYQEVCRRIDERRRLTEVAPRVQELLGLSPRKGLTIAGYLKLAERLGDDRRA